MLDGVAPAAAPAKCDSAVLDRNLALGRRHGLAGTPMLVFEDNERVPGILSASDVARRLTAIAARKGKGRG
jgi:thiol:disulfide interchange protein DsbC